jgi:hypothetical protein
MVDNFSETKLVAANYAREREITIHSYEFL